jgi:hypothetical protein
MSEEFQLSSIKIPTTVYVGFQGRRSQDEVPLGFMTPYEDTKAGQKRRDTVDNWAKGYWGSSEKTFNAVTLENKPMIGFKIGRSIRRSGGWNGSGASYVRVEDPRGFELEITIENLVMCMADNHIQDGEIVAECVWGRDGNRNILLPTNSEPYKASLATTEKLSKKLSLRDIKPGDDIQLVTGEIGTFMGTMYPLFVDNYVDLNQEQQEVKNGSKRYMIRFVAGKKFKYEGFAKITFDKIISTADAALEPLAIEQEVNTALAKNADSVYDSSRHWGRRYAAWVTSDKFEIVSMTRDVFTEKELQKEKYERNVILAESNSGAVLEIDQWSNIKNNARNNPSHYYYIEDDNRINYWTRRKEVHTTGYIGYKAVIGDSWVKREGGQTHIEEVDLKSLSLLRVELKSKLGETYSIYL